MAQITRVVPKPQAVDSSKQRTACKLCVQGLRRPAVRWSIVNSFVSNLEPLELTRSRTISLEVRAYRSIGTKRMSLKPTCLCAGKLLMCKRARVRVWTAERPATCCGISKSASSYPLGTSTSSCSSLIVSSVRLEQLICSPYSSIGLSGLLRRNDAAIRNIEGRGTFHNQSRRLD